MGFSSKLAMRPRRSKREDTHAGRLRLVNRQRGNRDVGVAIEVRLEQLGVVHPVEVIAGEDQVVAGFVLDEVALRLADGVGRALEPAVDSGVCSAARISTNPRENRSIR